MKECSPGSPPGSREGDEDCECPQQLLGKDGGKERRAQQGRGTVGGNGHIVFPRGPALMYPSELPI